MNPQWSRNRDIHERERSLGDKLDLARLDVLWITYERDDVNFEPDYQITESKTLKKKNSQLKVFLVL